MVKRQKERKKKTKRKRKSKDKEKDKDKDKDKEGGEDKKEREVPKEKNKVKCVTRQPLIYSFLHTDIHIKDKQTLLVKEKKSLGQTRNPDRKAAVISKSKPMNNNESNGNEKKRREVRMT